MPLLSSASAVLHRFGVANHAWMWEQWISFYFLIGSLRANCVSRTHVRVRNNGHSFIIQMKCSGFAYSINALPFGIRCCAQCVYGSVGGLRSTRLQSHANHSNDKRILNANTKSGTVVDVVSTVGWLVWSMSRRFPPIHSSSMPGTFLPFDIRFN